MTRWIDRIRAAAAPMPTVRTGRALDARIVDARWMRRAYEVEQRPAVDIARELDCSTTTVYRYLREHGIRVRVSAEHLRGVPMRPEHRRKIGEASRAYQQRRRDGASA